MGGGGGGGVEVWGNGGTGQRGVWSEGVGAWHGRLPPGTQAELRPSPLWPPQSSPPHGLLVRPPPHLMRRLSSPFLGSAPATASANEVLYLMTWGEGVGVGGRGATGRGGFQAPRSVTCCAGGGATPRLRSSTCRPFPRCRARTRFASPMTPSNTTAHTTLARHTVCMKPAAAAPSPLPPPPHTAMPLGWTPRTRFASPMTPSNTTAHTTLARHTVCMKGSGSEGSRRATWVCGCVGCVECAGVWVTQVCVSRGTQSGTPVCAHTSVSK